MIWEVTLVFFPSSQPELHLIFHISRKQIRWFWKLHVYFNFPLFKLLFLLHKNYIYDILLFKRVTCHSNTKWWNHLFWFFPLCRCPQCSPYGRRMRKVNIQRSCDKETHSDWISGYLTFQALVCDEISLLTWSSLKIHKFAH